jgi:hypothetical protein
MKRIFIITSLFTVIAFAANAQRTTSSYPHWTIGNEIQKMQFRNVTFVPSVVVTQRGPLSSKGIAEFHSRPTKRIKPTKVTMSGGTPSWIISKGVARMQYEKTNKQ